MQILDRNYLNFYKRNLAADFRIFIDITILLIVTEYHINITINV